jgi:two-component system LytT family response regulator
MSRISVVIVDDEPLARQKLQRLFEADRGFEIVGEAGDGECAVRVIAATRPLLVCLDIRLPGVSGLDVLRRADPRPAAVIFTTAYDQYAVSAFELAAVDYLLKPFSRERFLAAVERARVWLAAAQGEPAAERLREVTEPGYLARLFVRHRGVVRPLRTSAVQHLESNDDFVTVHAAAGMRFDMGITMAALEGRLDPASFLRIHRRFIVNMDHVTTIAPIDGSRFEVKMRDGTTLSVSRQRSRILRKRGCSLCAHEPDQPVRQADRTTHPGVRRSRSRASRRIRRRPRPPLPPGQASLATASSASRPRHGPPISGAAGTDSCGRTRRSRPCRLEPPVARGSTTTSATSTGASPRSPSSVKG